MKLVTGLGMIFLSCAATVLPSVRAYACGGCFHGTPPANTPVTPSVITGHRMALSISPERTVLWDQVQYAGDPKDFAWVLPVGQGAYLEQASDAWFESLEAVTATRIMSRAITCPTVNGYGDTTYREGGGSSAGCGFSAGANDSGGGGGGGGTGGDPPVVQSQGNMDHVTVLHQGTVGPYETVTIKATDTMGLHDWLIMHGYAIPDDIQPVIDSYVKAGSDFIALRLAPGAGVNQMTPVRVITPGASPILPLRMVAAGTGDQVSIVLYVIGEGRYETMNFPSVGLTGADVTWNWQSQSSDYATKRAALLQDGSFLTSYSRQGLTSTIYTPSATLASYQVNGMGNYNDFADVYFAQAIANHGVKSPSDPTSCQLPVNELTGVLPSSVVGVCPVSPMGLDHCITGADGAIPERELACGPYTDIAAALVGMHPANVVVTRLEAMLPHAMLNQDLILQASQDQGPVNNWLVAQQDANPPTCPTPYTPPQGNYDAAPQASSCLCTAGRSHIPLASGWIVGSAALLGALRRFKRRGSDGRLRGSR